MTLQSLIFEKLKKSGLDKSDTVLFHSNIGPLFRFLKKQKYNFDIKDIADCIIEYFSNNGTLIVPSFNFDFCAGLSYSSKDTPSKMGVLSEQFRKIAKINRTWHPVYSFCLFGNLPVGQIESKDYSAFGEKSIFDWLFNQEGKIAVLDLPDQNSMTFYHYVEQKLDVNWRFHKDFKADYLGFDNKLIKNQVASIFVRKIEPEYKILTEVHKMQEILFSKNLYISEIKNSIQGLRSIQVKKIYKEVESVINNNLAEGILYKKV